MTKICTRVVFAVAVILLIASSMLCVYAKDEISVVLDGQQLQFDVQPIIENGRTLVPMRKIFESLGATVDWDGTTKTVTSTRGTTTIKMTIGSKTMLVNGNKVTLDTPAKVIEKNGVWSTIVPVRAISESFGCQVGWDGKTRIVSIINDSKNYTMLYATGDRSRAFVNSVVDKQLNVGWYRDKALTDNMTDEKIYNKLKARGEASAYSCAETAVRSLLKNPDSMKVLKREIIDHDNYLRYVVKIQAQAANAMGGYVTDDYYIMLRVNPLMDGTFTYYTGSILGYEYPYTDSHKKAFDWGVRPSDFVIKGFTDEGEIVSVKRIIAFPEQYVGKYVTVEENVEILSNYIKDKYFSAYGVDDDGYPIATWFVVNYTYVENMEECVMTEEGQFRLTGYVKTYADSTDAYIDATIIEFIK